MSDDELMSMVNSGKYVIYRRNPIGDYCVWYFDKRENKLHYHQYNKTGYRLLYDETAFSQNPVTVMHRSEDNKLVSVECFNEILHRCVNSSVRYV